MDDTAIPSHLSEHTRLKESTRYAATAVRAILEQWFDFQSILDLGCGTGNWLHCLSTGSNRTIQGLEMEIFDDATLSIPSSLILHLDLGRHVNLHRRFDLALCLEVAEHLDPACASTIVENCVRHSDIVLFSAALPGQQGLRHLNERPAEYWEDLFARHDYAVLDRIRPLIWNDPQIPIWYRQNLLLYARRSSEVFPGIDARSRATARPMPLSLAHPEYLAYFSGQERHLRGTVESLSTEIGHHGIAHESDRRRIDELTDQVLERDDEIRLRDSLVTDRDARIQAQAEELNRQRLQAQEEAETLNRQLARAREEAREQAGELNLQIARTREEGWREAEELNRQLAETREEAERRAGDLHLQLAEARVEAGQQASANETLRSHAGALRSRAEELARQLHQAETEHALHHQTLREVTLHRDAILHSTAWRAFGKLRRIARHVPLPARRALRSILAGTGHALSASPVRTNSPLQAEAAVHLPIAALVPVAPRSGTAREKPSSPPEPRLPEAETASLPEPIAAAAEGVTAPEAAVSLEARADTLSFAVEAEAPAPLARKDAPSCVEGGPSVEGAPSLEGMETSASTAQMDTPSFAVETETPSSTAREDAPCFVEGVEASASTAREETLPFVDEGTASASTVEEEALSREAGEEALLFEAPDAVEAEAIPRVLPRAVLWAPFQAHAMRVVFVSGEAHTPGHIYRVERHAAAVAALGADVHWLRLEDHENHQALLRAAHVVILWRAARAPATDAVIAMAREAGAKLLFDVDDLVFLPEIATVEFIDGIRSQNFSAAGTAELFVRFREAMELADACLCTTEELANEVRRLGMAAYIVPNGFDDDSFTVARRAMRRWRAQRADTLIRIGYASGSRTHQRDFGRAAEAIARVLSERENCRLVLFQVPGTGQPLLDVEEFPCLTPVLDRIEWRDMVALKDLPNEIARFDINLAPLETGNIFCEAKSELKYFEAALAGVCTVASPTGPMARAIRHGVTGWLADDPEAWHGALLTLIDQPAMRQCLAEAAFMDAQDRFGPSRQRNCLLSALREVTEGPLGAQAARMRILVGDDMPPHAPEVRASEVLFSHDLLRGAKVTVVIPLYNYAHYIEEALESVRRQTLVDLDVVVVDDASTDASAEVAVAWMRTNAYRFNRAVVLRHTRNAGLSLTRNAGFAAAETPFVLPLDADNVLRPRCCETCLEVLGASSAGFAYPGIQTFGESSVPMGTRDFLPMRFISGNYVDAMALIGKWAWLRTGGYVHVEHGWEDYDFWCRCLEHGIGGVRVPAVLAEYRVHGGSMLHTRTDVAANKAALIDTLERNHPWLRIARPER